MIHCHAGKDRTGIIVTLLHLVAGADHETVQTDYLASESDTYGYNLKIVLDIIEQEGGVEQYLLNCGLSQEEVNALKIRMCHL
ncbi:MAG: tyrosine-protein phosphatase [Flavobacteriales bacterium]|nr:tyrosine-protein phosphatase [Flavobacteriales bacterium]